MRRMIILAGKARERMIFSYFFYFRTRPPELCDVVLYSFKKDLNKKKEQTWLLTQTTGRVFSSLN